MNIFLNFPLYLMERLKWWSSLYGYVMFVFLTTVSKGSACDAPLSPQCFRKNADDSVYMCEWSMNSTDSKVTFDIYFNERKFGGYKTTWCQFNEEELIQNRPVDIWVKAHVGNSSCASAKRSVVLADTVKYEAPQKISASWLKNNLSLSWMAAEKHPAEAEVWLRRHPTESWEKRLTNTTNNTSIYQAIVGNLLNHSSYQVQIRHRSAKAKNSLWSKWSPVVIIPADFEHAPEVTMRVTHLNGTRIVKLIWKPMPHAAAVRGVNYSLETQSSCGCPCMKGKHLINPNKNTRDIYVSYSAVNISVTARNAVGNSPPAIVQVPAKLSADLKACDQMLLENLYKKSCHEWYKLKDGDARLENVITLTRKKTGEHRKEIINKLKDYIRYLYFEHRCYQKQKPRTVQMCLFYKKEGVPNGKPQDLTVFGETHTSANLLWKAIPLVNQRGFLINYSLCIMKISPQNESKECCNISASQLKYHLENMTPGSKYNISLAGVTQVGEGPEATITISTLPEKPIKVWLSFGLLFVFFLFSTWCTVFLKRIQNKIFPPVPTPVIADFNSCQPENQEILEEKEEVHELTLFQLHPENKPSLMDAEESTVLRGEWDDGDNEDIEIERGDSGMSGETSNESPGSTLRSCRDGDITDLEQVDNEIAMLIYRNGLVFDLKTDSP